MGLFLLFLFVAAACGIGYLVWKEHQTSKAVPVTPPVVPVTPVTPIVPVTPVSPPTPGKPVIEQP